MLGAAWCTVGNALVAMYPDNLTLVAVNRFLSWSLTTVSGSVTGSAVLSDLFQGPSLAAGLGKYFGNFGLGVLLGPAIGAAILSATGSVRATYAARSVLALAQLVHDWHYLEESLPEEKRAPASEITFVSPFGFLRLFKEKRNLVKLVLISFLMSYAEGKNTTNLSALFAQEHIGLTPQQASGFSMLYGVMMFAAGSKVQPLFARPRPSSPLLAPPRHSSWSVVPSLCRCAAPTNPSLCHRAAPTNPPL